MRWRIQFASFAIWSMVLLTPGRADTSLEYAVKAAYLPKFIPFITWPDGTFGSPAAPVNICVLGRDPFNGRLDREAGSIKVGERSVAVRHVAELDQTASCQLLFLSSGSDTGSVEAALDATRGKPVVTVTDSGLKAHGVISFVIDTNHVRFDIDNVEAVQNGLTISSQLLGLAHSVRLRGQP
jgi:hypothetical protein